jgi:fucose permease
MNDGTNGPLLPAYQRYYHVNFMTVSLIFISNCIGFVFAAILNLYIAGLIVRIPIPTIFATNRRAGASVNDDTSNNNNDNNTRGSSTPNAAYTFTFSFSTLLTIAAASRAIGYAILSTAPPFPVVCVAFGFVGFGLSILNAHGNGFISLLNRSTEMGIAQALYGEYSPPRFFSFCIIHYIFYMNYCLQGPYPFFK